jgi:predicted molibdopterin-dependent oxidoreductase YjgC
LKKNTGLRIEQHPILGNLYQERRKITITVNGKEVDAYDGETIAAALLANGIKIFRRTPKYNSPRALFCAIGRCNDCVMSVNGIPNVRTCVTTVEDGMIITAPEIENEGL